MNTFNNKVAVVTGGASGIGKALVRQLLKAGAKVVVADVEQKALDMALQEFASPNVSGVATDVSRYESVAALADQVFAEHGACHLLFNNAGVAAVSCNIWETEVNDWKWVHGVNVMGVVHGILAFVPRMIASGEEGHIINTSSGDGGISPLPYQSVYASSKASVSIITECLAAQLRSENTKLRASVFYPSGGVLATGIWTTHRNRPADLPTQRQVGPLPTPEEFQQALAEKGVNVHFQDLDELAEFTLNGIRENRFVIMIGVDGAAEELHDRASRIGRAELPIDLAQIPAF